MMTCLTEHGELAETLDGSLTRTAPQMPGYLFFQAEDSCVPLFELTVTGGDIRLQCPLDRAALMNAIYQYHPEYAAQHNLAEQMGHNDGIGQFLQSQGVDVGLSCSPERLISWFGQIGTRFIDF